MSPNFSIKTLIIVAAVACLVSIATFKYAESATGCLVVFIVFLGAAVLGYIMLCDVRHFGKNWQFSLRTLFLATTLAAIGAGVLLVREPFPRVFIVFPFACGLFGAAVGTLFKCIGRFAVYGFVCAVLFVAYFVAT